MSSETDLEWQQIRRSLENGGKVVRYEYVVSVIFYTFRRETKLIPARTGFGRVMHGMYYNFFTFVLGWWGIPWGPIYTPQAIFRNCAGGRDCTREAIDSLGISQETLGKRIAENNIKKSKRMALLAFVLGILSLICNIVTGIPGIIIGHTALFRLHKYQVKKGKIFAIIGLVLSYLGTLLFILFVVFGT